MPANSVFLVILLMAIAIGWVLGRYLRWPATISSKDIPEFYQDLSFLFSEEPGPAVQAVIDNLPINHDTLPSHLSLAKLLRDRGEIEGATRIHKSLIASDQLGKADLDEVYFALAQDYVSAGLLDRAEVVLRDLLETGTVLTPQVLGRLQHIYQSERDWQKAIAVARRRLQTLENQQNPDRPSDQLQKLRRSISHYFCELAEQALVGGEHAALEDAIESALAFDAQNSRAVLLSARQQLRSEPSRVLNRLHSLMQQHPEYVREALPLYRDAFAQLPDPQDYLTALEALASQVDSSTLQQEIINQRLQEGKTQSAEIYFHESLKRRPTVKLLTAFPNLAIRDMVTLSRAVIEIEQGKPVYRCRSCGFSGHKLHWLCPGCEDWGTIAPIRGKQGD